MEPSSEAAPGTIFDIEAEEPAGDGARFFDDLRQADAEANTLGPLDEDTDAALSAFFDGEDEDSDESSRWRDRFGPGRS